MWMRWFMSLIRVLGRLRQEDHHKFKASFSSRVSSRLTRSTKQDLVSKNTNEQKMF